MLGHSSPTAPNEQPPQNTLSALLSDKENQDLEELEGDRVSQVCQETPEFSRQLSSSAFAPPPTTQNKDSIGDGDQKPPAQPKPAPRSQRPLKPPLPLPRTIIYHSKTPNAQQASSLLSKGSFRSRASAPLDIECCQQSGQDELQQQSGLDELQQQSGQDELQQQSGLDELQQQSGQNELPLGRALDKLPQQSVMQPQKSSMLPESSLIAGNNNKHYPSTGRKDRVRRTISGPTHFRHITKVGFDPDNGFVMFSEDEALKKAFKMVGVDQNTVDPQARDFMYDSIDKKSGLDRACNETQDCSKLRFSYSFSSPHSTGNKWESTPAMVPKPAPRSLRPLNAPPLPPSIVTHDPSLPIVQQASLPHKKGDCGNNAPTLPPADIEYSQQSGQDELQLQSGLDELEQLSGQDKLEQQSGLDDLQHQKVLQPQQSNLLPAKSPSAGNKNKHYPNKGRKARIRKEDIGKPTHFRHIVHMGCDPAKSFVQYSDDVTLAMFFEMVGVDQNTVDPQTRDFIYDFIDKNGGIEQARKETQDYLTQMSSLTSSSPPTTNDNDESKC